MRLGQLARQLGVSPDKILNFLAARNISVDSSNNARLDDAHADLILEHFSPGNDTLKQPDTLQSITPVITEDESETAPANDDAVDAFPEVIKAPKIELPGLRVLGKIDLPERKKPETEKENQSEREFLPAPARRQQKSYPVRERKNPITLAREHQEQEKKKKLAEQRELEKQRKKEFYEKRLRPQAPTKAVRIVREEYEEMPALEPEAPKTWWGRFMRWLTT